MSEIPLVLILGLLLLLLLSVMIVACIACIPQILDAFTAAKKAIDKYKRGDHE